MTWNDAQTTLKATLPGYESRPEQDALATAIENAFSNNERLLAQAGTGTGKSLAALIPSVFHALASGLPVVVATATKALQHQYTDKDLPFLLAHLGVDFTYTSLMGRGNYVCWDKVTRLKPNSFEGHAELLEEIEDHKTGVVDELNVELEPRVKPMITSSSDECPGKNDCPFGAVCFAEAAKQRARQSTVIVVNHSVLVTDAVVRQMTEGKGSMLPDYDAVVVDEAHELEEYATSALGAEFTQRSFTSFTSEVANLLEDPKVVQSLNGTVTRLFTALARFQGKEKTRALRDADVLDYEDEFLAVITQMRSVHGLINDLKTRGNDDLTARRRRMLKRSTSLENRIVSIVLSPSDDESTALVRWVEHDDKRGTILKYAPLSVAPFLRENVWEAPEFEDSAYVGKRTAVLLSATLAMGSDFSYIAGRLGVDDYIPFDAGSPFNYPSQAALYVPQKGFNPSEGYSWQGKVSATIGELVAAAGGRALLLFTSRTAMEQVYASTADRMIANGLTVLKQGEMPNGKLSRIFKEDETSVLFALKSFMTGIDVQGDALRLVVIDKLPFPVPTDVIVKARADAIDANAANKWVDGSFPTMTVPMMSLTLLQAFGRLIRTKQDKGLVAILDDRLYTKGYGKKIRAALPSAKPMGGLPQATEYLADLEKTR